MASQTGGVVQDRNYEASVGRKINTSKAPRIGGLGGRTPLGDLSNSQKPSLNQSSKKQNSGIFSLAEKQIGVSQAPVNAGKRKSNSKASEKGHTRGRKPLSDISNSGKPMRNEASKNNFHAKLRVLTEEPIPPIATVEEQFLHNHQECIKAQTRAMEKEQFLQIVGLETDFAKQLESPRTHTSSINAKDQSPSRNLELDEISEQLIDYRSCSLYSPPPNGGPISPKHYSNWKDNEYINFKLIESP